ncbi:MAG: putative nitroreductase YfkO, partial [Pseudomonadota bacterium]
MTPERNNAGEGWHPCRPVVFHRPPRRACPFDDCPMDLLNLLNWRYATKKFDPTRAVPEAAVERITEAVRLTAS